MLNIQNLSIQFEQIQVLKDISFTVQPNESIALMGANGTGKTSLLRAIVKLVDFTGTIQLDDLTLTHKTASIFRQKIGYVFQNPDDQLFCPTLRQDITFGLENMGLTEDEITKRVDDCLEKFNLQSLADRSAQTLSGGEKRISSLATVLVMNPDILLLDEPTIFLDAKSRKRLISALNSLSQIKIIATHDLQFARQTCTRAIILNHGTIQADGPVQDILNHHELLEKEDLE